MSEGDVNKGEEGGKGKGIGGNNLVVCVQLKLTHF